MVPRANKKFLFYGNVFFQMVLVFFTFMPFYFMVISSVKTNPQIMESYFMVTAPFHWENYGKAFSKVIYYLVNSVVICTATVAGVTLLACISAYIFARYEFVGKKVLFMFFLSFLMIPGVLTLIPQFVLMVKLHIIGTRWAAILPYIAYGQIMFVFILKTFIEGIPKDLFDSAKIDGANAVRSFINVVLPLAKPIITSLGLMNFLNNWNDFIWPLLVLKGDRMKTVTVGLYSFTDAQQIQYGMLFAGFVIASLPLILLFSFNMKYFIQGVTSGAIKA